MWSWAYTEFEYNDSIDNLVHRMIYRGKLLFFVDKMIPGEHDSVKIGFTKQELDFCYENESNMWVYLVENKLLFKTDYQLLIQLTEKAPFTKSFTRESPGRV